MVSTTNPGTLVGPGVPTVLTDGQTPFQVTPLKAAAQVGDHNTTGRRLAFASWLTRDDHPLTARVMVNRIFARHFGAGLAADLGNFGRQAEPPSHPQLLDWLALKFIQSGWSIKAMHRLMMNSRTYQQTSRVTDQHQQLDGQNRLLGRMPLQRLDAEALRDSLLFVSGRMSFASGGIPDAVSVDRDGLVSVYPSYSGPPSNDATPQPGIQRPACLGKLCRSKLSLPPRTKPNQFLLASQHLPAIQTYRDRNDDGYLRLPSNGAQLPRPPRLDRFAPSVDVAQ